MSTQSCIVLGLRVTTLCPSYEGTTIAFNPDAASLSSSDGSVTVSGQTTALLEATTGDVTMQALAADTLLTASHASNGVIVIDAGDTFTTSGGATQLATASSTASSAMLLQTGKASAGAAGGLTITSGVSSDGASGSIAFETGSTNSVPGRISITVGATTASTTNGGNIKLQAGEGVWDDHVLLGALGGSVSITAGAGTAVGGDVDLLPGSSTADGSVLVQIGSGGDAIKVAPSGAISVTATAELAIGYGAGVALTTGDALDVSSSGAVAITSSGAAISVLSTTELSLTTADTTGIPGGITVAVGTTTSADGGEVDLGAGGTTVNNGVGGSVQLLAGAATGTTSLGGDVSIIAGSAVTGGDVKLTLSAGSTASGPVFQIRDSGGTARLEYVNQVCEQLCACALTCVTPGTTKTPKTCY